MKVLLKYRANVNDPTEEGVTPFHVASAHNNVEFLEYLLQRGRADILHNTGILLQKAMVNDDEEVFKFIVREIEKTVKGDKRKFHVRV